LFQNANSGWHLPPKQPCAPVLTGGHVVDAVWLRLMKRVGPRPGLPLTDDPDLHLLVDGSRIEAASRTGAFHVFRLAATPDVACIASRAGAPQELGLARDPRGLGVALRRIIIRQGVRARTIEADDSRLANGFHAFEVANGFRWTDGNAVLSASLFADFSGPLEVILECGGVARYVEDDALVRTGRVRFDAEIAEARRVHDQYIAVDGSLGDAVRPGPLNTIPNANRMVAPL
jgi:hypothetical protein